MKMTKERMGEIALAILTQDLEDKGGFRLGSKLRRELGDIAAKTKVPIEELETFSITLLTQFIGKAYGMNSVSITMSDPIKTPLSRRPEVSGGNIFE